MERHAFEEILPPSASSSSPTKNVRYDVFINHRGPDAKQTLAVSIYDTLHGMGLEVFLDKPELELGDSIPAEIERAMTTSFLHIAILSPRYAESTWCLAELLFMLNTGKKIIPVFYNVDPKDIHWICEGKGIYADAFSNPKLKARYTSETLQDWKRALQRVSYLSGYILKDDDAEEKKALLKAIKDYIKKQSQKSSLVVAAHPVGIDSIVQDFERSAFDSSKKINIIGIVGMGGCGKTTLAKAYYNTIRFSIYKCSFIYNVRDVLKKDLHNKQKRMLQDLGFSDLSFKNVEEGKEILLQKLSYVQVFIVLDDVDHQDQLESLLPMKDNLEEGSVIIVTSRKSDILTSWGISFTSIYKMKELKSEHAIELFCWHAFQHPSPVEGFESLVEKFTIVCKGLPLSLKVLGGLVRGQSPEYWDAQLDKVSRVLHKEIKDTLKVSFDALDEEEQEIFLDIACFFIGEAKQLAVIVWDGSGWSGLHSLETLESKCLIELDERNHIRMHDHLRDLGKEIARKIAPYRLCSAQQVRDIEIELQENMLCGGIRGIRAETDQFYEECMELVRVSGRRFKGRLEILIVKNNCFTEELATLSAGPVWLRWVNFPYTALQSWLSLKKLRILELHDADKLEQLWNETADPPEQLRVLIISNATRFLKFPSSIGRIQHLKKIQFNSKCTYHEEAPFDGLPDEFCRLGSLEHIKLSCKNLKSLPSKFGDLRNLGHLDLSGCSRLMILPASFKQLIHLQHIDLSYCSELSFRSDILENMTKLETLNFSGCLKLQKLPPHITNQRSLKVLDVGFGRLRKLPNNIGQLNKLETLTIGGVLRTLPSSFTDLSSLTDLTISKCDELEYLPERLGRLFSLSSLRISQCAKLTSLPFTLTLLINLRSLHIRECPIIDLHILSGLLPSLLHDLKDITIRETLVSRISIAQQCCPSLETLDLRENYQLVEIDSLPASIKAINLRECSMLRSVGRNCVLPNLESLVIEDCGERLHKLPNFAQSISLEKFQIIRSASRLKKVQGLECCRSLKLLKTHTFWKVSAIKSLENMERLKRLELSGWKLSALEPCLRSIKKWPSECIICARTAPGVEAALKSFTFPGLTLVNSCVRTRGIHHPVEFLTLKCGKWRCSNEAMMMCFVINSSNEFTDVHMLIPPILHEKMILGKGTWVWMGIVTHSSRFARSEEFMLSKNSYSLSYRTPPPVPNGEYIGRMILDMLCPPDNEGLGMLVMGEENRVVGAFYQLLQRFGESM